jgi:ribonucleoside-diphosphate reductase beta chain
MITNIFDSRKTIQPYEYPNLIKYAHAIHESFWTPEHFTYDRDIQDFLVRLNDTERDIIKKCMLAIGVVENKVKTFWARIDMRMPKTEIAIVGHTFAGNEVIHQITYEKLLNLLGLEKEFENVINIPCMQGRSEYLGKYLQGVYSKSNKEFTKSLILFTLLIENASLFSQFLIVSSFKKHTNMLSNFNSVISATAREEQLHAKFGEELINIIRKENPEWFDKDMETKIRRNIQKAYKAEVEVLDWIFEKGELSFLSKKSVCEYLKYRFNKSLNQIGYEDEFTLDEQLLEPTNFLEVQLLATSSFDFFNEKSTDYSQNTSFDEEQLWD